MKPKRFQIVEQPDDLQILNVLNVDCGQSGEIKCIAKCPNHQKVVHTDLIVLPEPTVERSDFEEDDDLCPDAYNNCPAYIIYGPQDCTALIGGTVILEVIHGGFPEPTIKWMRAVSYFVIILLHCAIIVLPQEHFYQGVLCLNILFFSRF